MSKASNPYGDGFACKRIADVLTNEFILLKNIWKNYSIPLGIILIMVDFNERFILAFTKLLHSYVFTKALHNNGLGNLPLKALMKMEFSGVKDDYSENEADPD